MKCEPRQHSDQMVCSECGLTWDAGETDTPECALSNLTDEDVHMVNMSYRVGPRLVPTDKYIGQISGFQAHVSQWARECYGADRRINKTRIAKRFLKEALELAQACGVTRDDMGLQVAFVTNRPDRIKREAVGGAMITLAELCEAEGVSMSLAALTEFDRVNTPSVAAKLAEKEDGGPEFGDGPEFAGFDERVKSDGHWPDAVSPKAPFPKVLGRDEVNDMYVEAIRNMRVVPISGPPGPDTYRRGLSAGLALGREGVVLGDD